MNTSFSSAGALITEIISKIEIEDPFLCEKCQKFGYCEGKYFKHVNTNTLIPIKGQSTYKNTNITDESINRLNKREVIQLVNIRTEIYEKRTVLGKKVQEAHDLFHQDEFEQASYLYQDILQSRSDIQEAWKGLLACLYFLGKYDEAVTIAINSKTGLNTTFINKLINNCEDLLMKEKKNKISTQDHNSNIEITLRDRSQIKENFVL